jgi:hypothetical protein
VINGYPYFCRAGAEGSQASCDPFAANSACAYIPIGLFNRFDQAPESGAHCGEYRIVYAKQSGVTTTSDRNLLIFEAVLPNPHLSQGIKGCQQIVDTWAKLSNIGNANQRADVLEDFYFDGSGTIPAVVSIGNFGDNALGAGQIRSNQFSNTTTGWSLREFKLMRSCSSAGGGNGNAGGNANAGGNGNAGGNANPGSVTCSALRFVPVTNKNNAFGPLFADGSPWPTSNAFQAFFPSQVANLAASSIPGLDIQVPDLFNTAQSQASGATAAEMRYPEQFGTDPTQPSALRASLQAELNALGSSLLPDEIVKRAQALSCAGCHKLSNGVALGGGLSWPSSLGFTHVSERETELAEGQVRFRISDTLIYHLLPARKAILEDFLNNRPRPAKGPTHPLSGSSSHG